MGKLMVQLKVRRFDLTDEPEFESVELEFDKAMEYQQLKNFLYQHFNLSDKHCVIKTRNADNCLVPLGQLLRSGSNYLILDIANIKYNDAHIEAMNKKVSALLHRLKIVEEPASDLEWKKQADIEDKINILTDRMEFLNKRFDHLLPTEAKQHIVQNIQS